MSLYNFENGRLIKTSERKGEHWELFNIIVKSEGHKELRDFIRREIIFYIDNYYSDKEGIASNKCGAYIINKIKGSDNNAYIELYGTLHGSIFGMMLYDYLDKINEPWYILPNAIDDNDPEGGTKYFKKEK